MSSPGQPAVRRRRIWLWVLGICVAPFAAAGAVAYSYLALDHDARVLRGEVMEATDARWHTKVQVSVGRLTVDALRAVLLCVHHKDIADARLALSSVRNASVGVYEVAAPRNDWSRDQLFVKTDEAMNRRGWTRLVGVAHGNDAVLAYVTDDLTGGNTVDLCVAVVDGRDLVIVSTTVDASLLAELVERHAPGELKRSLHLARF